MQLYLRTHPIGPTGGDEGWKYLGFSNDADKRHYKNGTSPWLRHCKKHGHNYSTEIILEADNQFDLTLASINYSLEYDIWNNPEYANQMMENGLPGAPKRKFWSESYLYKTAEFVSGPAAIAKGKATKLRNNTHSSNPEIRAKCKATREANGLPNNHNIGFVSVKDIRTGEVSQVSKKAFESNGFLVGVNFGVKRSQESIIKSSATRKANGTKGDHGKNKVSCRDLRTGKTSQVTKEIFDSYDYLVGVKSKKENYNRDDISSKEA